MSYVFGLIDDKVGTVKAAIVLGLCELMPILGLMLQPEGGSKGLMLLWGFGVACMTGGVPTLHPCIMAFAYGRREYQAANRIIMVYPVNPVCSSCTDYGRLHAERTDNNSLHHAVNRISSRYHYTAYNARHERCQRS